MLYLLLLISYLSGSVPTSVWIGKVFFNLDIREHGSGNAGTTNTFRVLGKKAGIVVFVVDVAKGIIPVLLPMWLHISFPGSDDAMLIPVICGVLAITGHIFPVFAGFRGGKGVATSLGVAIGLAPLIALICFGTFMLILLITKYVSLGSVSSGLLFALLAWLAFESELSLKIFAAAAAVMLVVTHTKNISRLLNGNERKTYLIKNNYK
jgi:glycerol-3-phosphate acyltransferase PlsY